ncbi:hypothetical protein D3C80_1161340 [compost metagenome]
MQAGQVVQRGVGRGGDVATAIVEAGLAQVEVTPGGGDELPQAYRMGPRIGHGVVGALDRRQQGQLQRHVALFEAFDDVVDVQAATVAGVLEERGVAGEPQALLFDTRVDRNAVLQHKALAHAFPDVLRRLLDRLDRYDQRFLLGPCLVVVRANAVGFVDLTGALAAHESGGQG